MKIFLIVLMCLFGLQVHASEPLLIAIENNDIVAARKILKAGGVDINYDKGLYSPLVRATHFKNPEMVDLILEYGADPNLPGPYSRLPIDWAIQERQMEMMKSLLKKKADINLLSSGHSLLETACSSLLDFNSEEQLAFQKDSVEWLFENGLDLNKNVNSMANILSSCARYGNKDLLEYLFSKGDFKAVVNKYDFVGTTPLVSAIFNYRYEHQVVAVIRFLLENGADPNLLVDGKSPLSAAQYINRKQIIKVLKAAGAKP